MLIQLSDSYKYSHYKQYPKGTEVVYSYLESRGGMFDETVFYGLQPFIKAIKDMVITEEAINKTEKIVNEHMGPGTFNKEGWMYIVTEHGGRLPVKIRAVAEGTVVPVSNALMTIENTDPKCFWLTNWLETAFLQVWYPITVCTLSRECKKLIKESLKRTCDVATKEEFDAILNFRLHDFGFRGVSSILSACIGGSAHLVNFMGSDTFIALNHIKTYYNTDEVHSFSIPASEHSTITSWGDNNEYEAFGNMLDQYPNGLVACVSDSYDICNAVDNIWPMYKEKIMRRNGTLVIRPDSGDIKMTLQYILNSLWKNFGGEVNSLGYKVLDPHVRVIQGDGMNYDSLKEILSYIETIGFSTENVAFGMGGALLQKVDRDTQKFAFKCSAIKIDGKWQDVYKAPTELDADGNKKSSFKKSKVGRFSLIRVEQGLKTVPYNDSLGVLDHLKTVFNNGSVVVEHTFEEIKQRAALL